MFYVCHEGLATKRCNEVCSFLFNYINTSVPSQAEEIYLLSDNCPGQNKNIMIRFLLALVETGWLKKIYYYLPIREHSFLPCDRDFALVKQTVQ